MKHSSQKQTGVRQPTTANPTPSEPQREVPLPPSVEPPTAGQATQEEQPKEGQGLPDVLTVLEVASLLRCERKTVYEAIRRRGLPHQKISARALRFSREAVLEWLRSGQVSHKGRKS